MKRRGFFALLLGGGAAAQSPYTIRSKKNEYVVACVPPLWSSTCKAVNGQCPVCGEMAERYKRTYTIKDCEPVNETAVACKQEPQPGERIIRCKRCNAIFGQDAD